MKRTILNSIGQLSFGELVVTEGVQFPKGKTLGWPGDCGSHEEDT